MLDSIKQIASLAWAHLWMSVQLTSFCKPSWLFTALTPCLQADRQFGL